MSPPFAAASVQAAGRDCSAPDPRKDKPAVEAAQIVGAGKRIAFIKGEPDNKACPAATATCRPKAFVVPGNKVLVSGSTGEFVRATYVNMKGVETR